MSETEVLLVGGERLRVEGEPQEVEAAILSASRGSLLELAWVVEVDSRRPIGINPDHVVMLRTGALGSSG